MLVSGFRLRAPRDFSIPSSRFGQRGITSAFGYSAPHPSAGGTSTLLIWALPSAHYGPSRHPLVFGRLPGWAGYMAYLAPVISHRDEEASPVAWHVLVTVLSLPPRRGDPAVSVRFRLFMSPSPYGCRLGPRGYSLSRPQRVHFCYGPVTRNLPGGSLVDRLRRFCFHLLRYPNYGALTATPAGLSEADPIGWTGIGVT